MNKTQQGTPSKIAAIPVTKYDRMKRQRAQTFAKIQYNRRRHEGGDSEPPWERLTTAQRAALTSRAYMESIACVAAEEKAIRKALEGVVEGCVLFNILKRDGYCG